ncbi:hypothetical protein E8M12_15620 [Thalassotalea mangrovi]|uniref:RcnB family protein n=2 Tax=Thalassotalea mangrovi TaxID=2572245 RepID=A0A4U1B1F2_9GAMM|nr:hypothetical protein E8M12_15620 [Thalassotalea mangrovi]
MQTPYIVLIIAGLLTLNSTAVFAKNDKDKLPPGLKKKAARGELPPGWQKKLQRGTVLSYDVYRHRDIVVPVDKHGIVTVKIDGKLIRLVDASREIIDILN